MDVGAIFMYLSIAILCMFLINGTIKVEGKVRQLVCNLQH